MSTKKFEQSTVGDRVKKLRIHHRLKRGELAEKCGLTTAAISHYENNFRQPSANTLKLLARTLQTTTDFLNFGELPLPGVTISSNIAAPILSIGKLPVITWAEILSRGNGVFMINESNREFEPVFEQFPTGCFCIDVEGDSMISAIPFTSSFLNGTRLYVNPHLTPNPNDYVIAKILNTGEAVFRQYIVESGREYLKPLNSQYPMLQKNAEVQLIGVVTKAIYTLRH